MGKLESFITSNKERTINYLSSRYSALSRQDIEDVFQDSSIALYEKDRDGQLQDLKSSLYTYFVGICTHKAINSIKKLKPFVSLDLGDQPFRDKSILDSRIQEIIELTEFGLGQDDICSTDEIVDMVMTEISPKCHNIFLGYYWDNLSNNAIASMYGYANANVVKSEKYRCIALFRKKYHDLKAKFYGD